MSSPDHFQPLAAYGFGPAQAAAWAEYTSLQPGTQPARVVRVERNGYRLMTAGGEQEAVWPASHRHRLLDVPVIGDWVACTAPEAEGGLLRIETVLARRQTLTRAVTRGRRKEEQLLAANLDTVLVMTTQADWDTERLGRYLQAVSLSGAAPVILLNKADELRGEFLPWAREQLQAQDLATPLLPISAAAGTGLEALGEILRPAQTAALIGSSGMGKSTLTNRLLGGQHTLTGALSDSSGEGHHTTTWRSLYRLPAGSVGAGPC